MSNDEANKDWLQAMQAGQKWLASGNLDRAAKEFRLATRICPTRVESWVNLGAVLLEQGSVQEATEVLLQARALCPDVGAVQLNLAYAFFLAERYDEALAACRAAIAITPTADALNKLGVILRISGKFGEAEAAFREAIALAGATAGRYSNAGVNLATLLLLMGRFAEARESLELAGDSLLPDEARKELNRATLMLTEWERLDPVMRASFHRSEFGGINTALNGVPLELLAPDPVVTPFLQTLARSAERLPLSPPRSWPVPDDWPWIEAHFCLHKGDTIESYLQARKLFESSAPSVQHRAVAQFANAVSLRRNGAFSSALSPWPDAVLRYVHWMLLHGLDDAKYCPGHFKLQPNKVDGNPREKRADPEYVIGTVRQFYGELLPRVTATEARAMCVYVMIIKAHCFIDGNGRVARFLINQELERGGSSPLVIPDFMAEQLVDALHLIFRTGEIQPFMGQIQIAQSFTQKFLIDLESQRARSRNLAVDERE